MHKLKKADLQLIINKRDCIRYSINESSIAYSISLFLSNYLLNVGHFLIKHNTVNLFPLVCVGLDSNQRCPKAGDLQSPGIATIRPTHAIKVSQKILFCIFSLCNT